MTGGAVAIGVAAAAHGLGGTPGPAGRPGAAARSAAAARSPQPGRGSPAVPAAAAAGQAITAGPDGIEAAWIRRENSRPGTTAWKIPAAAGGIAGFADRTYASAGEQVTLLVSTAAPRFRAQAFRMGYYQGKGARLVWQSAPAAGTVQAGCGLTAGVNLVSCAGWKPSLRFTVTPAFVPGDYLIKLAGGGRRQSYVPLTIWDPASAATYLIKNDVYTWQAWNPYGGYDFYQGPGTCPPNVYPLCSRARAVSFDRPYGAEQGSGNFLALEYPLIRFAEQHALDVTYATDVTVEQHPSFLLAHRALLSLGHDECWSLGERRAAVTAHDHGVNIVFFAASPILRHIRLASTGLGPDRLEIDYRDSAADPLNGRGSPLQVTGNTWGAPPSSWPEAGFVGEMYAGFLEPGLHASMVISDASAWPFAGTGLRDGSVIAGVVASDVDHFYAPLRHPPNVQILSHSPIAAALGQTQLGPFYSDMTFYTDSRSGAGVLDTGTNNWIPALQDQAGCRGGQAACPARLVQQITGNILLAFGQGPAGRLHPSVANWRQVTGQ